MDEGQILAGKYRIERVLGEGGMGRVVAAVHEQLHQRVAIKFLLPEALRHQEAVARFLREARAAVKLRSEHVGRVIDVGTMESGAPFMVMEFLEGHDLAAELARGVPLPVPVAIDYILQACDALAEAHALGIVHRDIKPANLFLTRRADGSPLVKVLDFGISKAAPSDPDFNMTRTQAVMGSPGYMSPEQLRSSRDVDARTDIWALGVVLYELVSGRKPFQAESFSELCIMVATEPPAPLVLAGGAVELEGAIARCLQKDPAQRFGNVAQLAAALEPFAPHAAGAGARIARVLQLPPPALPTMVATGAATPTTLGSATGERPATPRRGRGRLLAGGALIAALAAAGIALALVGGDGTATPAVAPPSDAEALVVAADGAAALAAHSPDAGVADAAAADAAAADVAAADRPEPAAESALPASPARTEKPTRRPSRARTPRAPKPNGSRVKEPARGADDLDLGSRY